MPVNKTVEFKGAKDIDIDTLGRKKIRISLVLAYVSIDNKLSPVLIFKGKREGKLEKVLCSFPIVLEKNYLLFTKKKLGVIMILLSIGLKIFMSLMKLKQ